MKKERNLEIKKVKEKLLSKKFIICFLSFVIPMIILIGYVLYNQFMTDYDFFKNGKSFLTADMGGQYNALYSYIRNVFLGRDSIFYSFHNSLGGNMASTIGYYLASPFNILYVLVPRSNIPLMTYIIYVLKISLCSLFMNIFLSHKFGCRYANLIFSLTYAFMGFVVVYFFNNMWLDVIYMTPLVIMGIEKLIDGKPLMYIITLALSIIFNFYIAYMLCIFCVIYFIYELFIRYSIKDFSKYKRIILRFIISSLLAGGLVSFFLVPVLINLTQTTRSSIDKSMFIFDFYNFHNRFIQTVFSKSLIASNNRINLLGRLRPVVYISFFSIILSYLYFFNKKISRKEKVLSFTIILFFLLSFMIPHLQFFWQAGSLPNGYIDRYSFMYCFFLILLSAKCFYNKNHVKIIWFISFILVYSFLLFKLYKIELSFLDKSDFNVSFACVVVYLIICFIYLNVKIKNLREFIFIIFLLVLTELVYNYRESIVLEQDKHNDKIYKIECKEFNNRQSDFYRIDGMFFASFTDSFACDYYTITGALSTNNSELYSFYYNHGGSETSISLYNDYNNLPILNSILGVDYIVSGANDSPYNLFKTIKTSKKISLSKKVNFYKNLYALNLGYIIDENFDKNYSTSKTDGLYNLNTLMKALTGEKKDVLVRLKRDKLAGSNLYKYHIDKNDKYLYISTNYERGLNFALRYQFYINDKDVAGVTDVSLGAKKIKNKYYGQDIITKLVPYSNYDIYDYNLYYFDEDEYKLMMNKLSKNQLQNIIVKGNKLYGNIDLNKKGTMLLTVPYDKGWRVYVDGKKVPYKKIADAFIGIDLDEGHHEIKMKYYPSGILLGSIITLTSIIVIVLYNCYLKKGSLHKMKKREKKYCQNKKNVITFIL